MSLLSTDLVHEWRTSLPIHASSVASSSTRTTSCNFRSNLRSRRVGSLCSMPVLGLVVLKRSGLVSAALEGKEKEQYAKEKEIAAAVDNKEIDVETVTKKYGLEAGLWEVGIHVNDTGEKVGTFALAYAAHKALSPIRFPPTVALTPIVAGWFGKKPEDDTDKTSM